MTTWNDTILYMGQPEKGELSLETEREKAAELVWLEENLTIFWPAAHFGYEQAGRGAVVITIESEQVRDKAQFHYADQAMIKEGEDEVSERLAQIVAEYDPEREFVAVIIKPDGGDLGYTFNTLQVRVGEELVLAVKAASYREGSMDSFEADENLAKIQALSDQFEPLYQQVSEKLKTRT